MTALSDLLNDAKGEHSVDYLIQIADKRGKVQIPPTARAAIYKALAGNHAKNPREESLEIWAEVFQLDVRDLREAAARPRGELGPWEPVTESAQLNQEQRTALDQLIKTIVRGNTDQEQDSSPAALSIVQPLDDVVRDVAHPLDEDLDALPDERDEQQPIPGRRPKKAAARKRQKDDP